MKPAKFKVGDKVTGVTKHKEVVKGTVQEVRKTYQALRPDGSFDPKGLRIDDTTVPHIKLPFRIEGETLYIEHPEQDFGNWIQKAHTDVYKLSGYSVVFRDLDLQIPYNYSFPENALKFFNPKSLLK